MNGKKHSETGTFSPDGMRAEILNPFVHKLELDNTYDKIRTAIFTVILLPFRVIVICYLIVTAWFLACIGLYGLSEEDLRKKPMTGWRSKLRYYILSLMRLVIVAAGFHRVKVIGREHVARGREAPVVVMAPHSSFFDAIAIVCLGAPSVVAKADTAKLPFIGPSQPCSEAIAMVIAHFANSLHIKQGNDMIKNITNSLESASNTGQLKKKHKKSLKPLICFIGKMSYLAGGMAITIRGRQASRREAPILVVAPHSSFLDSCIVYATRMSSVIVRKESMDNYVGKLINYTQPVYVWRDDPNSRQNTIKEIIERATSKEDWPQVLIFPEGTCTNRSCLITFKPGGFYPGVPVQPVTIRYPNARDTVTWTWEGPGALKLLWLTLTQVHSSCEIEFLPVYYPTEEEKKNPKLFARNVRDVMARALGVPVLDYTYDDCRLIAKAKQLGIPGGSSIREVAELRCQLKFDLTNFELDMINAGIQGTPRWLNLDEFALRLGVLINRHITRLYKIFLQKPIDLMFFPDYLLATVFLLHQNEPHAEVISYAFKIFDGAGMGRLDINTFEEVAVRTLGLGPEEAHNIFRSIDLDERNYITYDEFAAHAQNSPDLCYIFSREGCQKVKSQ
ncbi:unnamed protein product [Leptosia nina]|uniref:EF-hand domain-containing protein n=1 Tax=Leptosia nina TaxID=320188 RepID=A0AAV1J8A9_9NEOP